MYPVQSAIGSNSTTVFVPARAEDLSVDLEHLTLSGQLKLQDIDEDPAAGYSAVRIPPPYLVVPEPDKLLQSLEQWEKWFCQMGCFKGVFDF